MTDTELLTAYREFNKVLKDMDARLLWYSLEKALEKKSQAELDQWEKHFDTVEEDQRKIDPVI